MVSRVGEQVRFVNTENGNTRDCILKAAPRQTAGRTGELVFNALWSYVLWREIMQIYSWLHICSISDM